MNMLADITYTPDDLLRINGDVLLELVDGKLVEKGMGARSSLVGSKLSYLVSAFLKTNSLGVTFGAECGYQIWPDRPNRVRKPDFSFVRRDRLGEEGVPEGWFRIHPDLAAEVISPNDNANDVAARVVDFLRAGTPLVWLLDPRTHFIQIFRQDRTGGWLLGTGELSGGDVLPGFRCRVEDVFAAL